MSRLAFAAVASLALAACSTDGTAGTSSSGGTTTGAAGATFTYQNGKDIVPSNLTVAAGSTVTFVNNDIVTHTATSETGTDTFKSGQIDGGFSFDPPNGIPAGSSATITIPAGIPSGTVQPWFCQIHTTMMTPSSPTITIK